MPRTEPLTTPITVTQKGACSPATTPEHGTIWVITEDLRGEGGGPITTVLFPGDY